MTTYRAWMLNCTFKKGEKTYRIIGSSYLMDKQTGHLIDGIRYKIDKPTSDDDIKVWNNTEQDVFDRVEPSDLMLPTTDIERMSLQQYLNRKDISEMERKYLRGEVAPKEMYKTKKVK